MSSSSLENKMQIDRLHNVLIVLDKLCFLDDNLANNATLLLASSIAAAILICCAPVNGVLETSRHLTVMLR